MAFQLGSALMDACVLAVLTRGDTYGYVFNTASKRNYGYIRIHFISCS